MLRGQKGEKEVKDNWGVKREEGPLEMCSWEEGFQLGVGPAVPGAVGLPKCVRHTSRQGDGPGDFSESSGRGCPMARGLGTSSS